MKLKLIAAACCLATSLIGNSASAAIITVDPDAFPAGTVLSNAFSGVTLSSGIGDNNVYSRTSGLATTGTRVFGHNSAFDPLWLLGSELFRADFATPTSMVWLDFIADDGSDVGELRWFNSSNVMLGSVGTGNLSNSSTTLMASEATATIAYIVAGGVSGEDLALDNLRYKAVPEPGTLALFGLGLAGLGFARRRKAA